MAQANATIQQHQPLRVPSGWGAQEKRFISQLEEILDDLYSRFNRIKMTDLGKDLQKTISDSQAAIEVLPATILATVQSASEDGELYSSLRIDENGITMTGGNIVLSANSQMDMRSGGVININGASGSINLGEGSLINASQGVFGTLNINGREYLPIIVSETQPQETGIFWAKKSATTQYASTSYSTPDAVNRGTADSNWSFNQPNGWGSLDHPHVHTAPLTGDILSGSYFEYTFRYPFLCWHDGNTGAQLWVTIARGNKSIAFSPYTLDIPKNETVWAELTLVSDVNLFDLSLVAESFTITSWMTDHQGVFTFTQANCQITLTGKVQNANPVIACDLFYIP